MHRTGELYGQFQTLEQQKESSTLGMWIFLVTEVLFFGGMFLTYAINRHEYFTAFGVGSNTLDITLGTVNTIVLIMSSFTMAMAVWSAQTGKKKLIPLFLILTLTLGCVFLGIKFVEYKSKWEHQLFPGKINVFHRDFSGDRPETIHHLEASHEAEEAGMPSGHGPADASHDTPNSRQVLLDLASVILRPKNLRFTGKSRMDRLLAGLWPRAIRGQTPCWKRDG